MSNDHSTETEWSAVHAASALRHVAFPAAVICRINEQNFIAQYVKMTGATETLARNIYMLLEPAYFKSCC